MWEAVDTRGLRGMGYDVDRKNLRRACTSGGENQVLVLCVLARRGHRTFVWFAFCFGSIIRYVPLTKLPMPDTDRFSQLILSQLEKLNDNQEAARTELRDVGKLLHQIQTDNDHTKEKLKAMDEEIKLLSLQTMANQEKLRQLEPVLTISATVKQIILKGIGIGVIAMLLWYFSNQMNLKLPWKE